MTNDKKNLLFIFIISSGINIRELKICSKAGIIAFIVFSVEILNSYFNKLKTLKIFLNKII